MVDKPMTPRLLSLAVPARAPRGGSFVRTVFRLYCIEQRRTSVNLVISSWHQIIDLLRGYSAQPASDAVSTDRVRDPVGARCTS